MGKTHAHARSKRSGQGRKSDGATSVSAADDGNAVGINRRDTGPSNAAGSGPGPANTASAGTGGGGTSSTGHRDGGGTTAAVSRRTSVTRGGGSKNSTAQYAFAHPLSESLRSVDLMTLARGVRDWRSLAGVKPCDELEEKIVDRLIQLERLQVRGATKNFAFSPISSIFSAVFKFMQRMNENV